MGKQRAEVPSPGVAAFIGFAAQAGASALHTLPFGFNPGDATVAQEIGVWSAEV